MSGGHIVVGIDDSPQGRAALIWAVAEAALRDAELEIVHVVDLSPLEDIHYQPEVFMDAGEATVGRVLADVDVSVLARAPARTIVIGSPAGVLLDKADHADLVVVGARGHGGFGALLLGSVSTQLVHHAPCPVVVVR